MGPTEKETAQELTLLTRTNLMSEEESEVERALQMLAKYADAPGRGKNKQARRRERARGR